MNEILRKGLKYFTTLIFVYQTITFLVRYHESPTVIITSERAFDRSYQPRLLVCGSKSYDYDKSRHHGYYYHMAFLSGDITNSNNSISWNGQFNRGWTEIESAVFPNIKDNNTLHGFWDQNRKTEKTLIMRHIQPFAVCNEIVDFGKILYISLVKDAYIYLADPSTFANHRVTSLSMNGDNIGIPGVNKTGYSSLVIFRITISVLEKRTDQGKCKQYTNVRGYSKCIENGYINLFKKVLGCLPPWFRTARYNDSEITCTNKIEFNDKRKALEAKAVLSNVVEDFVLMQEGRYESDWCLPPCNQIYYNVEIASNEAWSDSVNWAEFNFAEEINVQTETNGYDTFRLVIEVGSSLGLWLGLCIFGLFDLTIEVVKRLKDLF